MTGRVVVLGAGVAGLTTALSLARGGIAVDVLERDRAQGPLGRRSAATWVRDGAPQVQHAHVFGAGFHRLLASELPDVLELLLAAGARELSLSGHGPALGLRRPLLDWVLRRVAEREPGVRVHCGTPATGLRTDGSALTGVLVAGGVLTTDLAVDATGCRTPTAGWLADLGHLPARPAPPGAPQTDAAARDNGLPRVTFYSRCYSLRWPGDPGSTDFGVVAGGRFEGYRCHAVPGDNDTFTVTFGIPSAPPDAPMRNASDLSALRLPEGFQAAAEHVPVIGDWVDRRAADPLTTVAVLRDWPPAREPGLPDYSALPDHSALPGHTALPDHAALPGLVAVGDARGVRGAGGSAWGPPGESGVARAIAQGLACASAVLSGDVNSENSAAELERRIAAAPSGDPRLPAPRHRPLGGPDVRELAHIAASVGAAARISA